MATRLPDPPLVTRYRARVALDAEPTAIVWQDAIALVALGDGTVAVVAGDGAVERHPVHGGAILAACRHPRLPGIVTGGDDGRVCHVGPHGAVREIGQFGSKWVGQLAASSASGLIVAAVGREVAVWTGGSAPSHRFALPGTVSGLALDPKGKRLAATHYGGATLLYPANAGSGRLQLGFAGSHLACTLSPDGRFLVTALQETGLHGWLLATGRDMGMTGYRAKTRSFAWDRRGRWLATSGDRRAVIWPFDGRTGPMGRPPLLRVELAEALVTRVAFHPCDELLAVGCDDGAVLLARLADEQVLPIDGAGKAVTALAWNDAGTRLAWGDEDGRFGMLDMQARR